MRTRGQPAPPGASGVRDRTSCTPGCVARPTAACVRTTLGSDPPIPLRITWQVPMPGSAQFPCRRHHCPRLPFLGNLSGWSQAAPRHAVETRRRDWTVAERVPGPAAAIGRCRRSGVQRGPGPWPVAAGAARLPRHDRPRLADRGGGNAGTDGTAAVARRLAGEFDPVAVRSLPGKGGGTGRATGGVVGQRRGHRLLYGRGPAHRSRRPARARRADRRGCRPGDCDRPRRGSPSSSVALCATPLVGLQRAAAGRPRRAGPRRPVRLQGDLPAVAHELLPEIEDDGWFFDTELIAVAERSGLPRPRDPRRLGGGPRLPRPAVVHRVADLRGIVRLLRPNRTRRRMSTRSATSRRPSLRPTRPTCPRTGPLIAGDDPGRAGDAVPFPPRRARGSTRAAARSRRAGCGPRGVRRHHGAGLRAERLGPVDQRPRQHLLLGRLRAMSESWKNFFFNAFDPGGFITVDKPPVAMWFEALSVRALRLQHLEPAVPSAVFGRRVGRRSGPSCAAGSA